MSSGVDLCSIPASTAPDGSWDFVHFESLTTAVAAVCVVTTVLAVLVAMARIYVNRRHLLVADYFTALAVVFSIAYLVLVLLMAPFYRHEWNIPACWFDAGFAKLRFCIVLFSGPVQFFPRASIFLLYRQLFQVNTSVRIAIWIGLVGTFLINAPNIPISIVVEAPHPGETWEDVLVRLSSLSNGWDARHWGPIQGAASVALDIFAFVLPLPIIAKLNLARSKKTQLIFLFSTALLGVAASIVALVYKVELFIMAEENRGDQMWLLGPVNICIDVESNIAIIVGSMPAFANFMRMHVAESRVFLILRSKLGGSDSTAPASSGNGPQRRPLFGTIGSPLPRKKVNTMYMELTDSNILNSRNAIAGGEGVATTTMESSQSGILRTTAVTQQSHHPHSTDNLV